MSLNARLAALEMKLGISSNTTSSSSNALPETDVPDRLAALQVLVDKYTTTEIRTTWHESHRLLQELDPGEGLTYQQQPLLYKRQEILAAAPQLRQDFQHLSTLVGLLHNTQQQQQQQQQVGGGGGGGTNTNPLTADTVTQAPILTSLQVSLDDQRRLDSLRVQVEDLNGRTRTMTTRLHQLLEAYHAIMTAASEKCILVDEVLSMKEAKSL
jgi:hypothetical protein